MSKPVPWIAASSSRAEAMGTRVASESGRDLGFGVEVACDTRLRFLNRDGTFNVQRKGLRSVSFLNLYHFLLTMRWSRFLMLVLLLYFLSNVIFGSLYAVLGDGSLVDISEAPMMNIFLRGF